MNRRFIVYRVENEYITDGRVVKTINFYPGFEFGKENGDKIIAEKFANESGYEVVFRGEISGLVDFENVLKAVSEAKKTGRLKLEF
jgi:hypothetical protein